MTTTTTLPYLIVGGGMAADAAVRGIRSLDRDTPITLIGDEPHAPYRRPPLSKGLWSGETEDGVWLRTSKQGVDLILGRRVVGIDLAGHSVTDERGVRHRYQKLLLATGASPRTLPGLPLSDRVRPYRSLDDFRAVSAALEPRTRVAVIGGGFIGAELGAALNGAGAEVHMVFPEANLGGGRFPPQLASRFDATYLEKGVRLHPGRTLKAGEETPDAVRLTLDDGSNLDVALVVLGIGAKPNTELAEAAGIHAPTGIPVDATLRTVHPDVFAAGDVALFPHAALGRAMRVEHEDAAYSMGRHAGRGMAGRLEPYLHVPFFYGDLFDDGYEAVGELDAGLRTSLTWTVPDRQAIVYYHDDERVRGLLLFNEWGRLEQATELLQRSATADLEAVLADRTLLEPLAD